MIRIPVSRRRLDEIYAAPELAVLALFEAAADVALVAIVAAHPDDDDLDEEPIRPELLAARALADAARAVTAAVNRYRLAFALARQRERDARLPF